MEETKLRDLTNVENETKIASNLESILKEKYSNNEAIKLKIENNSIKIYKNNKQLVIDEDIKLHLELYLNIIIESFKGVELKEVDDSEVKVIEE